MWGLVEYNKATADGRARRAARRAAELLLEHRLFRSSKGTVIHSEWEQIHWPHYWHYDFFHGLRAIAMLGLVKDPRASDARELLLQKRRPDGMWRVGGRRYWRRGNMGTGVEVVTWGDAHEIVTPAAEALIH